MTEGKGKKTHKQQQETTNEKEEQLHEAGEGEGGREEKRENRHCAQAIPRDKQNADEGGGETAALGAAREKERERVRLVSLSSPGEKRDLQIAALLHGDFV